MKNILKVAGIFMCGWLVGALVTQQDVENGTVIHDDDEMYVKASDSKSHGWSYAKVVWKNPEK